MTTISRRTLLGAMAALPAATGPGRAQSPSEGPDTGEAPSLALLSDGGAFYPVTPTELARYHLDAYKAAVQAADPTITGWWKGVHEDEDGGVAFWLIARRNVVA